MTSSPRGQLWYAAILALLATATTAHGQTNLECADAYERGQEARLAGDLLMARTAMRTCSSAQCPDFVRNDCRAWLPEVDDAIPSFVVLARDPADRHSKLTDVRVFLDGKLVATQLDAQPIEADPGEHTVRFEYDGQDVEQTLTLKRGDDARLVTVQFTKPQATEPSTTEPAAAAPSPPTQPEEEAEEEAANEASPAFLLGSSRRSRAVYALGGLAGAGLGLFSYFAATGARDRDHLEDTCSPLCSDNQVSSVRRSFILADTALGMGVTAAGLAVYLALTRNDESPVKQTRARRHFFSVDYGDRRISARWQGRF